MTDAAPSSSKRYSWADFIALDDDDRRELIDGELALAEVPNKMHEHIVAVLIFHLMAWARRKHGGLTLGSGYKIRIDAHRGVTCSSSARAIPTPQDKTRDSSTADRISRSRSSRRRADAMTA